MNELIGKKILSIQINDDQSILAFNTEQGVVAYEAEGDCCSECWFADITGVHALLGATVRSSDEVDLENYNVDDGRCRQDEDEAYGFKLTTDKGYTDIVFRNSSNGFYGGWINLYKEPLPEDMTEITVNDWTCS
jgi:hypothetical protein